MIGQLGSFWEQVMQWRRSQQKSGSGYTILELLVVFAVLGTASVISLPVLRTESEDDYASLITRRADMLVNATYERCFDLISGGSSSAFCWGQDSDLNAYSVERLRAVPYSSGGEGYLLWAEPNLNPHAAEFPATEFRAGFNGDGNTSLFYRFGVLTQTAEEIAANVPGGHISERAFGTLAGEPLAGFSEVTMVLIPPAGSYLSVYTNLDPFLHLDGGRQADGRSNVLTGTARFHEATAANPTDPLQVGTEFGNLRGLGTPVTSDSRENCNLSDVGLQIGPEMGTWLHGTECKAVVVADPGEPGNSIFMNNEELIWEALPDLATPGSGTSRNERKVIQNIVGELRIGRKALSRNYYHFSDGRLKEDVQDISDDAAIQLDALRTVRYRDRQTGEERIGLIAQDVRQYFPELVKGGTREDGSEATLAVDYIGMMPILIQRHRQQKQEMERLQVRLEQMEARLSPQSDLASP